MPIYQEVLGDKDAGTFADFMEAFKTFDREGQGFVSAAEVRHVLSAMGDRLTDEEVEEIIRCTDTQEDLDGNIKYEGNLITYALCLASMGMYMYVFLYTW